MLFSEELMHLTLFCAHCSYGKGFLPLLKVRWVCSVMWSHPLYVGKQLSGTDIQKPLLLGLEPLGLAGVFLECSQDLCSDLSVRETQVHVHAKLPYGRVCILSLNVWVIKSKLPDIHIRRMRALLKVNCEECF